MKHFSGTAKFEQGTFATEFHLDLFELSGDYTAIITGLDFKATEKHLDDGIFDIAREVAGYLTRDYEIPHGHLAVVLHFAPTKRNPDEVFHRMEIAPYLSAATGTIVLSGRMLQVSRERLTQMIGEEWTPA